MRRFLFPRVCLYFVWICVFCVGHRLSSCGSIDSNTHMSAYTHRHPTSFLWDKAPSKQVCQHLLVSPPAPSCSLLLLVSHLLCFCAPRLSFSSFFLSALAFIVPFSATLVWERQAIMQSLPPLRPLLWGRVAWPVCWAGEKGERRGQGEL